MWQNYQEQGRFDFGESLAVASDQLRTVPDVASRTAISIYDMVKQLPESRKANTSGSDGTPESPQNAPTPTSQRIPATTPTTTIQDNRIETNAVDSVVHYKDTAELEMLVDLLINKERLANGLAPLSYDQDLATIARNHSNDMARSVYFSHVNLQGEDPTDRAVRQGYRCRKDFVEFYTDGIAENIFQNWLYSSVTYWGPAQIKNFSTTEEIAVETVNGWMNSPGHRVNILEKNYDRQGIGVAVALDDKVYITQNFC